MGIGLSLHWRRDALTGALWLKRLQAMALPSPQWQTSAEALAVAQGGHNRMGLQVRDKSPWPPLLWADGTQNHGQNINLDPEQSVSLARTSLAT